MDYHIRQMPSEQIGRIGEIDDSDAGEVVYKWVEGRVQPVRESWRRGRADAEKWKRRTKSIRASLAAGGAAFGAFDGDRLVGFAALRYRLGCPHAMWGLGGPLADDVALLQALWVGAAHRRQGIATALTRRLIELATDSGARAVYVSGMPSVAAQAFYRSQGFEPAVWVHRELYEREPEDIHLVKQLQ